MADTTKAAQAIQIDPYQGGKKLLALSVGDLLNQYRSDQYRSDFGDLIRYGEDIWRAARSALVWWTPARTEQEALRRAADDPSPSVIAQEVDPFGREAREEHQDRADEGSADPHRLGDAAG